MRSPAWALEVATVTAINEDEALQQLGVRMYQEGSVPPKTKTPYITSGTAAEQKWGVFGVSGHTSSRTWHIWAQTKEQALKTYDHVAQVVEATEIQIDGHQYLRGSVQLVMTMLDPSGLYHAALRFECKTYRAPLAGTG